MVLDSEEQRQTLLNLLDQVPLQVSLGNVRAGNVVVSPEIAVAINAIVEATVQEQAEDPGQEDTE